jgi:hypothetical protein
MSEATENTLPSYSPVLISSLVQRGRYVLKHGRKVTHVFNVKSSEEDNSWFIEDEKLPGILTLYPSWVEILEDFKDDQVFAATKIVEDNSGSEVPLPDMSKK